MKHTKTITIVTIAVLILLIPLAATIASPDNFHNTGELLAAFTMRDGAAVSLTLEENQYGKYLSMSYSGKAGMYIDRQMLGMTSAPDVVMTQICGEYVQAFANWTHDYDRATGPVYLYTWVLPYDSGLCLTQTNQVWMPFIVR